MLTNPAISTWSSLVAPPSGELFGKTLAAWRASARKSLGLPEKPIIVVGHQPEFFHPGILAKFVAASQLAKEIDGVLVHLVVDHHVGNSGVIEVPDETGRYLTTKQIEIAKLDVQIAMKDQPRVIPCLETVFSKAIANASGENAAMQFAHATDDLMKPWAQIDFCLAGTSLLRTEFGKAIIKEMRKNPEACITAYNNAVLSVPECGIPILDKNELPLWAGKTNKIVATTFDDLRPRALLLTLLARVVLGDLFVHGIGGFSYDNIMEKWLQRWLCISPCAMTMATATIKLPFQVPTIEQARRDYFSPPQHFLDAIESAPYGSPERKVHFLAMHKWLENSNTKPDLQALKKAQQIANRRDWAFPLYKEEITKGLLASKLNQSTL